MYKLKVFHIFKEIGGEMGDRSKKSGQSREISDYHKAFLKSHLTLREINYD